MSHQVGNNGGIHEFADSQFGHLFASGPTREDARKALGTLNPEPCTLHPAPCTLHPRPWTLNPEP